MKKYWVLLIGLLLLLSPCQTALAQSEPDNQIPTPGVDFEVQYIRGEVVEIIKEAEIQDQFHQRQGQSFEQHLQVKISTPPFEGQIYTVLNMTSGANPLLGQRARVGDKVVLYAEIDKQGKVLNLFMQDLGREKVLWTLAGVFVLLMLVLGRLKGLAALASLLFTGFLIAKVLLPAILKGYNPLLVTIGISSLATIATMVMVAGLTRKTLSAVLGTVAGVLVAGLFAFWAGDATRIVGLDIEEASLLLQIPQNIQIDFRGLLFSGIIIGTLGAVMDVGISIASAIHEVRMADPSLSRSDLFKAGMNIGKDVMGTMSNTLILAYAGSSIPLLLLYMAHEIPMVRIVNSDLIASEIIRSLAGSIGLIMAIPLTAFISAIGTKKD